jgi:predicted DNA-binding transcriptional regulator YafY
MEKAVASNFPFRRPEQFDVKRHLDTTFGIFRGRGDVKVQVKFLPAVSRYVLESHWHPSQEVKQMKDGTVLASFRLDDTREFKSWILSFGKHAVVLAPEELRREILVELETLVDSYRPPKQLAGPGVT